MEARTSRYGRSAGRAVLCVVSAIVVGEGFGCFGAGAGLAARRDEICVKERLAFRGQWRSVAGPGLARLDSHRSPNRSDKSRDRNGERYGICSSRGF